MKRTLPWAFVLTALCATLPSCGSDDVADCNVADACVAQCAEECAPAPVNAIGCLGNACRCVCGSEGGGGTDGGAGTSGTRGQ